MNTPLRIATITGALTLALSAASGATTVRLVPLGGFIAHGGTAAPSINGCAAPYATAAIKAAAPAVVPIIAAEQNVSGITSVRIELDPRGNLTSTSVLDTSGNRWLDLEALRAARLSRYSAEVNGCERVGGAYSFVVDFTS